MSVFKRITIFTVTIIISFSVFITAASAANSKAPVDIFDMSVSQLQQAVDDGYLTYYTIMKLYLDRIYAYGDQYNAIITINENALNEAKAKDEEFIANGRVRSSEIFGLPVLVKDNIDVKGLPTTAGSKLMSDNYPLENSPVVQSLIDQGAIILAKTNMSYFAISAYESSSSFGYVYNAFNTSYSSYGSSSGSSVGVAAKLAPLAIGTDTNSSLRTPASANGVVALRPTYSLLSLNGIVPYDHYRDTAGPIANNVFDCAMLLGAMEGDFDKYTEGLNSASLKNKTIGIPKELVYSVSNKKATIPILKYENADTVRLMEQVAAVFEKEGATVIWLEGVVNDDINYLAQLGYSSWTFEPWFNEYIKGTTGTIRKFSQLAKESGILADYDVSYNSIKDLDGLTRLENNTNNKNRVKTHIDGYFARYNLDAIIYPTLQNGVQLNGKSLNEYYSNAYLLAPSCGYPAITVPMGTDSNGFPMGLEIMCQANEDGKALSLAYAYEQAAGNHVETKLVPSLYEVPGNVKSLMELYRQPIEERKENKNDSVYYKITDAKAAMTDFFANYDNVADPSATAIDLIEGYSLAVTEYKQYLKKLEQQEALTKFLIIFVSVIVLITVVTIVVSTVKRKARKRAAASARRNRRRY